MIRNSAAFSQSALERAHEERVEERDGVACVKSASIGLTRTMKFSIVVPSFNQAQYLRDCLESLVTQTISPAPEIIVMDGGSTDGSVEIIKEYESRITYWQSQKDGGQTAALIEGFKRATGDAFGWLNSDDYLWSPNALQKANETYSRHPEADMVCGDLVYVKADGTPYMIDMVMHPTGYLLRYFMVMAQQATFFRSSAYERVGGLDPSFNFCMDYDLFQRIGEGGRIVRIPEFLAAFRQHEQAKTSTIQDVWAEENFRCWERSLGRRHHGLWGHVLKNYIRLLSLGAETAAMVSGRKMPTLAHARIGPMVRWARRRHGM